MNFPKYHPRATAPLLGAVVGSFMGSDAVEELVFAGIGLLGGLIVMLLDKPAPDSAGSTAGETLPLEPMIRPGSTVHRFMAILSVALCWVPMIGFNVSFFALALNWKARGWMRRICLWAFMLSIFSTVVWGWFEVRRLTEH